MTSSRQVAMREHARPFKSEIGASPRNVAARIRARAVALSVEVAACLLVSLLIAVDPASAAGALFRVKRTWWFSSIDSWTNGYVTPRSGVKSYAPPAIAYVGNTAAKPRFTAPKSFIKNTTLYYRCGVPPSTYSYCYYGISKAWYSYWNARGRFRPQNPNAPQSTTTVRFATTMSNPTPSLWSPHTAMYGPVTPTTTWGGRYDHSRGGSIRIWPGPNRFGGTIRFFDGPNARYYLLRTRYSGDYSLSIRPKPLSQQLGTGVEIAVGEATEASVALRYALTEPFHIYRKIIGTSWPSGPQYDVREAHYLVTRAPYTTGKVRAWEPLGNTNTIQTATGYDNRTPIGLRGNISLVHPRLIHAYSKIPASGGPQIKMTWSSARMRRIDFRFLPEPAGCTLLVLGALGLARIGGRRRRASRLPR